MMKHGFSILFGAIIAFSAGIVWSSPARMPLSPSDMTAALEQKIVSGTGFLYPGSDLESTTTPALALLDDSWPDAFLDRIGETISVRVSPVTGCYEFSDESGSVFWIEVPVTPLLSNWVASFLYPSGQPVHDAALLAPWHVADRWRLSTETLEINRRSSSLLRSSMPQSRSENNVVSNLCFTSFHVTETNLSFTAAWPTNESLPGCVLDLYCSTNGLTRFPFLLSSQPATNSPVSFEIPSALVPNWNCASSHIHDALCPAVTNTVLSPLDGTTVYTNIVYGCPVSVSASESAFFRLGSRLDTDGDGLSDAYECFVTGTSTNAVDTDLDGLSDAMEISYGTDPTDPDSDGDGLDDAEEILNLATNPLAADTDGDGLSDRTETGSVFSIDYRWFDSGSATNLLVAGGDENGIWTLSLSSPFIGDGVPHHRIAVDTNGVVFLLEPGGSVTNAYPSPQSLSSWTDNPAHIAVAALWCALESDSESALRFFETTSASVVEFDGFLLPGVQRGSTARSMEQNRRASFQIVLPHTIHDTLDMYYREIPEGGISVAAIVGVQNRDRGYFLLPEGKCTLPRPGDPALDIASGRGFRFHLGFGTNPLVADTDGDGLNDSDEISVRANPLAADTDGDGVPDAEEVAAGTDPNDPADNVGYQSGSVLGNGAQGVHVTFQQVFPISKNTAALVGIWVASEEFPEFTKDQSEYDDTLSWALSANGVCLQSGVTNVNALHTRFVESSNANHRVPGMLIESAPVDIAWYFLSAPTNQDLSLQIDFQVTNVSDGNLPSAMMAAVYPLRVVQANWPDSKTATDFGVRHPKRIVQNGIAYVTGEPAAPALTAQFQNLPHFIEVGWSLDLVTERSERGNTDNRQIPSSGRIAMPGNQAWNIAEALNEIVGGKNTISFRIGEAVSGSVSHFIRGKNPLDADVENFIEESFSIDFHPYAKLMAKHESWENFAGTTDTGWIYNQFNNRGRYAEMLNKTSGDKQAGWGIFQITDLPQANRPDVAWNWKTNALFAYGILVKKRDEVYHRFIGYFRDSYGHQTNWVEPPSSYTLNGVTLSAEAWGTMTYYNGTTGITPSSVPTHPKSFSSVWICNPVAQPVIEWTLLQNRNNYTIHVSQKETYKTKE